MSEQATPNPDDGARHETLKLLVALCRQDAHSAGLEVLEDGRRKVKYRRLDAALTDDALRRHLAGGPYVGVYPVCQGTNQTRLLIFDLDDHGGSIDWDRMREMALQLREATARRGLRLWAVRSGGGRGIHMFAFWDQPQLSRDVRNLAKGCLSDIGFTDGDGSADAQQARVFPHEDFVQRGKYGSMIAVPFGRLSAPLDDELQPIERPLPWVTSAPLAAAVAAPPKKARQQVWSPEDIERLQTALAMLPSEDRHVWINYGQAIKHDLGEAGWPLWDKWSAKAPNYGGEEATRRTWDTLDRHPDAASVITTASIFHAALDAGWEDPGRIIVRPGLYHQAVEVAMRRLVEAGAAIYQRSGELVRVARSPAKDYEGHAVAVPSIVAFTKPLLASEMAKVTQWYEFSKSGKLVRCEPNWAVVSKVHDSFGYWPFPPLHGIISTPTMRPDGTLLTEPGYDAATGYELSEPPAMPVISEHPTRDEALAALAVLDGLLEEFPFVNGASRSVALSAMLTTVCRAAFDVAPVHLFDAPAPGTGKTYLAVLPAVIATGTRSASITLTNVNHEENEKRLSAAALTGQAIISIDNCAAPRAGAFLLSVTSEPRVQIRILGLSENRTVENAFTVFIAGNNIEIAADFVRRCIKCRLDSGLERPEEREFNGNPEARIKADRGRFVAAALTVVRAYVVAGFPESRHRAGFEAWSRLVRSALIWLDRDDPLESIEEVKYDDPARQERSAMFEALAAVGLVDERVTTGDIVKRCTEANGRAAEERAGEAGWRALYELLIHKFPNKMSDGAGINSTRLGKWFDHEKDRSVDGYKLVKDRSDKKRSRWGLEASEAKKQEREQLLNERRF
jgi:hypothetical protein